MKERKTCLRKKLEQLSTPQLDDMLQSELQKEHPEKRVVLTILKVLEKREKGHPVEITEPARAAWDKFKENTRDVQPKKSPRKWIVGTAAVAAMICLVVLVIPRQADADNLFDRLLHLTDSVLQFFDLGNDPSDLQREQIFQTENPGLQQLYEKVVELGVTEPVVPMWLPEGYDLEEMKTSPTLGHTKIYADFADRNNSVMIWYKLSPDITSTQYETESDPIEVYEVSGVKHVIIENEGRLSVAWAGDGIECSIVVEMEKEDLYKIVDSIYWRNTK